MQPQAAWPQKGRRAGCCCSAPAAWAEAVAATAAAAAAAVPHQRPLVGSVPARDLLLHCGHESLGVEEPAQPEAARPAVRQPARQLLMSAEQPLEPRSRRRRLPAAYEAGGAIGQLDGADRPVGEGARLVRAWGERYSAAADLAGLATQPRDAGAPGSCCGWCARGLLRCGLAFGPLCCVAAPDAQPLWRRAPGSQRLEALGQLGAERDGAGQRAAQGVQLCSHQRHHAIQAVDLLSEVDGQRRGRAARQAPQLRRHLLGCARRRVAWRAELSNSCRVLMPAAWHRAGCAAQSRQAR